MKKRIKIIVICLLSIGKVFAQSGVLDSSFGNNGVVSTNISTYNSHGFDISEQQDGKIVVVGSYGDMTFFNAFVTRYLPNGQLDNSFGTGGKFLLNIDVVEELHAVKIQQDGKIVAAGYTGNVDREVLVIRLNTDGQLDNTFGSGGMVMTNFLDLSTKDIAEDLLIQPDGKILICGSRFNYMGLLRLNSDGTLDGGFGSNGKVSPPNIPIELEKGYSIATQPDGKILVTGKYDGWDTDICVVRFLENGSLDNSFGTNGISRVELGSNAFGQAIQVLGDGKILISGIYNNNPVLMRFLPNGVIDSSFANNGYNVPFTSGASGWSNSILIQSDSTIVLSGEAQNTSGDYFSLYGFNQDGSENTSFGFYSGYNFVDVAQYDFSSGATLQGNGQILQVGWALNSATNKSDIAVLRYQYIPLVAIEPVDNNNHYAQVFPNPSFGELNIDIKGEYKLHRLVVYNPLGEVLYDPENKSGSEKVQVNLNNISTSDNVFFLKATFEGGDSKTYKVIKAK